MGSPVIEEVFRVIAEAPLYHLIVEIALFILLLYFIWQKSYNPKEAMGLTKEEQDKLIDEWQPEDLVSDVPQDHVALKPHIISGKAEKYMVIDGTRCLNLASHNYLGLIGNKEIEDEAIATVRKYGVGSCGPRGFYGTVDVHLLLEERLARFTLREQAVVYSYNFSTIASAIPAYCKRNDIIFADENVNFAIQKGLEASRSDIRFFKHNDPADLERLLKHQHILDLQNPKKAAATRRFLVVEGIYINSGDICPLPEIIKLRYQYKFRIIMDESVSLGSIGNTGRGVTEYYGLPVEEVDMISGSMEYALGTIGGFCVGSCFFVEHQRLAGLGYCFSASLPPLLAAAAIVGLNLIENNPDMFPRLQSRCRLAHKLFDAVPQMTLKGDPDSPVKHLHLKKKCCCEACMNLTLHQISNNCIKQGVAFAVAEYLPVDKYPEKGSIRFTVNKDLEEDDLKHAFEVLKKVCEEEIKCDLSSLPSSSCSVEGERQHSSQTLQLCDRGMGSHYCGRLSSLIMLPQAL